MGYPQSFFWGPPDLNWDAMLDMTKVELELNEDADSFLE